MLTAPAETRITRPCENIHRSTGKQINSKDPVRLCVTGRGRKESKDGRKKKNIKDFIKEIKNTR